MKSSVPSARAFTLIELMISIALVLASMVLFFFLRWVAEDGCLDAGGRVLRGPVDQFCEFEAGRKEPLSTHLTQTGWALVAGGWLSLAMFLYWAGRRFIRGAPPTVR